MRTDHIVTLTSASSLSASPRTANLMKSAHSGALTAFGAIMTDDSITSRLMLRPVRFARSCTRAQMMASSHTYITHHCSLNNQPSHSVPAHLGDGALLFESAFLLFVSAANMNHSGSFSSSLQSGVGQ